MSVQIKSLIDHLQSFPAIWDSNDECYHRRDVRDKQLEELATLCNANVLDLKKKYNSLRTRFRKVGKCYVLSLYIFVYENKYCLLLR